MKEIKAYIQPFMLQKVITALNDLIIVGMGLDVGLPNCSNVGTRCSVSLLKTVQQSFFYPHKR